MRWSLLACAALVATAPSALAAESSSDRVPALPGWMAGCWEARDGARWAEECWTIPRAGTLLGSGRRGSGDRLGEWEFMRIALDEPNGDGPVIRMAFAASPGGKGWTLFAWSPDDRDGITFHNAANDYPQVIRYWREGARLKARISMADGSKPMEWDYAPMGGAK